MPPKKTPITIHEFTADEEAPVKRRSGSVAPGGRFTGRALAQPGPLPRLPSDLRHAPPSLKTVLQEKETYERNKSVARSPKKHFEYILTKNVRPFKL